MAKNSDRILDKFVPNSTSKERDKKTVENKNGRGKPSLNFVSYPENIGVAQDLQHAIYFYINVRGKSKYKQYETSQGAALRKNRLTPKEMQDVAKMNIDAIGAAATGMAAAGLAATSMDAASAAAAAAKGPVPVVTTRGGAVKNVLKNVALQSVFTGVKVAVGVGAGVAAAGAIDYAIEQVMGKLNSAGTTALKIDIPERISDVIVLPIEQRPSVSYNARYREQEMGMFAAFARNKDVFTSGGTGSVDAATLALAALGNAPTVLGMANPIQTALGAGAAVINPYKEVFFEGIDYRNFTFNYTFLPGSKKEVISVMNIIDLFKFHMHPEYIEGNSAFMLYPSEFDIEYYHKDSQNQYLNKISTCALTSVDVNYGGAYFSSFEDGAPAEISLKLSFRELELLTKERIIEGY